MGKRNGLHLLHRLTDTSVKKAKTGRHTDGGGLYLVVTKTGGRSWIVRTMFRGKRLDIGLGGYPTVDLKLARQKAADVRLKVDRDEDPRKRANKPKVEAHTFASAMIEAHKVLSPGWAEKTAAAFKKTLEDHALPKLGGMPIDKIARSDVIAALAPIWSTKPQMARKVRSRIAQVLDYAEGRGWRAEGAPTIRTGKHLPKQPKRGHFAALPYMAVPEFIADQLAREETASRLALIFVALTAARSGEVRGALWDEVDLKAREWRIPGTRMKAGREHVVTLSSAALTILDRAKALFGDSGLVFPGQRRGSPLSDMTLSKLMRASVNAVPHGLRASFRMWGAEATNFPRELLELALAHVVGSQVERAYQRSDLRERRRPVMEAWGQFIAPSLSGGGSNVVSISGGAQAA